MKKLWIALAALIGLGAATPAFASNPGELTVRDNAKLFTAEGIKAAKDAFAAHSYESVTHVSVVTVNELPGKRKEEFGKIKDPSDRKRFFSEWARDEAKAEGANGIFVLISVNPSHIHVSASEQMRANRHFSEAKVNRMAELLITAFKESRTLSGESANQGHDVGLAKAVEYAGEQLKGTSAVSTTASHSPAKTRAEKGGAGTNLFGWICLIGVVLLGVWLVVGVIRALTGMGGGGGGGYGPGGGYGGGGGGFMSSLMGGMFGTMAGMWMYNSMFGGGMSSMSAGDYGGSTDGGGDYGGGTAAGDDANFDNGADAGGDWGGDAGGDAGGGDYGGGDFGGGDFGGGGGDFGGGGDW